MATDDFNELTELEADAKRAKDLNWSIEIVGSGRTYLCYRAIGEKENKRIIELLLGTPSLNDIAKIQNYLDSYRAVPI